MNHPGKIVGILFLLFIVLGCSRKVGDVSLPGTDMEDFSFSGTTDVPDQWWMVFENEQLNRIVDTALVSNMDLQANWYHFREYQALRKKASSSFFPTLEGSGGAEIFSPESSSGDNQSFDFNLMAQYEIDLWGRLGASVQAEKFRANASYFDYQTSALTLSAEIVRTYFQLITAREQVAIADEQVKTNQKVLKLLQARFGSGQIRQVDILRQKQLLESTREEKIRAESTVRLLSNQLSVLSGRHPRNDLSLDSGEFPEIPPLPETGLPTELIRRRPDVKRAFALVKAADKDLASAISNQFPRLSISASLATNSNNADDLFNNWVRSFAGNLVAPLFYGGELSAEVDRSRAVKQQQIYLYGQNVLSAFREVEDALVEEQKQRETVESLERQLELARQSNEQTRVAFFNGVGSYLDVLTALDEEQALQRRLLTEKMRLLDYRIALYRALAGGFDGNREPEG